MSAPFRIGIDLGGSKIAAVALAGDGAVRAARRIATPIGDYGGSIATIVSLVYDAVPRRWGGHILPDTISTRLLPPRHGDASGVRGAAWLWPPGVAL